MPSAACETGGASSQINDPHNEKAVQTDDLSSFFLELVNHVGDGDVTSRTEEIDCIHAAFNDFDVAI